jgi:uncharacterized protein with ParB-like and HNH nuclease domain
MIASQVALSGFLTKNRTQFIIPVYQRNYDWTNAQCKQLLEDIIEVGNKTINDNHFVGSIVFIHEGIYTTSEVNPLVIIDGQQRLTTITLLYLALYKYAKNNGMEEKATEINETILINRFVTEDSSKLKLKQTDVNARAFKFLMSDNDSNDYSEYSRLIENFNYFSKQVNGDSFKVIIDGLNRLLFVEISLERGKDDPQRIFESLNSTGLELSQADLIRNYILMGLEPKEQIRVFHHYWEVIENNAKIEDAEETKVSDLIRDYLTLINKKIPNKGKVYEEFKNKFHSRDDVFYNSTLNTIKQYSIIYNKLLNPDKEPNVEIRKELNSIKQLEINVSFPFLLPVYDDFVREEITREVFIDVLKLVQSFTWRRFILGLPSNALNKIFMTLYNDVNKKEYLQSLERSLIKKKGVQRFPNDKEIETALKDKDIYNIQAKNKLYFLEQLEHFNNRELVNISSPDITVEHIFPQNPESKWKEALDENEYKMFRDTYLHTIANLTLSGNNGALGNKIFTEKKVMNKDGGEQGYIFSNFWLNRYLKEIDEWTILELNKRFEDIYERFLKIWIYPEVDSLFDSEEEEYNIFNAPDPRGKKIEYYIFRDEKIVEDEVSKMYYQILTELFTESPSKFLMTDIKDTIGLTANKNQPRSAYPINDTYFIEANIDSNSKFRKLKFILSRFEMEDELFIKYVG